MSDLKQYFFDDNMMLLSVLVCLILLAVLLTAVVYGIQNHTVRIYNWNGRRFCYLGRELLCWKQDGYYVQMRERLADLSHTTLYQICPSKQFVRKHRYHNLTFRAGDEKCMLHVEECMRQSIYYRRT